jgi:hypothetical protein
MYLALLPWVTHSHLHHCLTLRLVQPDAAAVDPQCMKLLHPAYYPVLHQLEILKQNSNIYKKFNCNGSFSIQLNE